jgi:adenine-specific DNA-methyltransferase
MSELKTKMMKTPDLNQERLDTLKKLYPDLFTIEGKLNPDELKKIIDSSLTKETERFEFKWFGKSDAKKTAFTPSQSTLIYDEARSVNPDFADGNMIIDGENLDAMKVLLSGYRGKIKCIYIDPPYNTGKDFVYSDNFDETKVNYWEHAGISSNGVIVDTNTDSSGRFHSNWLNLLYSRLLLSRQLLSDDGVIFISIDDKEVSNLRKMCDEVFGEDNFMTQVIVRANSRGQTYKQIAKTHEYILIYTKSPESELNELEKNGDSDDLNLIDDISKFNIRELRNRNPKFGKHNRPNLFYAIYVNPNVVDKDGFSPVSLTEDNKFTIKVEPFNSEGKESCYRWGKKNFLEQNNANTLKSNVVAKRKQDGSFGIYEKYRKTTYKPKSIWDENQFLTETGTVELGELGLGDAFAFPKPISLIKQCVLMGSSDEDIILDFFGGSGTTAHAVFDTCFESNLKRRFIIIQIPELITTDSDIGKRAIEKGFTRISDITIERLSTYVKKHTTKNIGFKVYKLAKSHFPRVEFAPDQTKSDEDNLALLNQYIKEKEASFNTLFESNTVYDEVLLKNGFMLNYTLEPVASIKKNKVYLAKDEYKETLVCLDASISKETLSALEPLKEKTFICLERALDTTMKWNLKHELGDKLIAL